MPMHVTPGTPEFAADYGYGQLSYLDQALRTHPSAKGDPNAIYNDGLTRDERADYFQTLQGVNSGYVPRRAGISQSDYRSGGCFGRDTNTEAELDRGNLMGQLWPALQDLEDRANADPRLLDYDREWSACMTSAGFQYASSAQAVDHFQNQFFAIWATAQFASDAFSSDELAAMTTAERTDLYELEPDFDRRLWDQAKADEIDVASQDLRCQGDNDRHSIYVEVLRDLEDQFVTENQNLVDQILAID